MKKTIKIIDLLNMISKGEEVPKRIIYDDNVMFYSIYDKDYLVDSDDEYIGLINNCEVSRVLNDEVEIIEEPKKIEKIEIYEDEDGHYFFNNRCKKIYIRCDEIDFMVEKFNELIDEINNLKEND